MIDMRQSKQEKVKRNNVRNKELEIQMSIYIEKETEYHLDIDCNHIIEHTIQGALEYMDFPYEAEVNVVLTDNDGIHEVNREFRQIDRPTDVLSFPFIEYEQEGDFSVIDEEEAEEYFNLETGEVMLGDIMISLEKVVEQAKSYGHSKERELAFLTAHSMLHLFGFDHMEEEERIRMERLQEEILSQCGYTRQ